MISFAPVWQELASIAVASASQREYRSSVLRASLAWFGGDGGFVQQVAPRHAHPSQGCFHEQDMGLIMRCFTGWEDEYAPELVPLAMTMARHGAALSSHALRSCPRSAFHSDILASQAVKEALLVTVAIDGPEVAYMCMMDRSRRGRAITPRSLRLARALGPVIALGDRLVGKARRPAFSGEVRIARLTAREREISELVVLGYTNAEIAMALGTSPRTVRNQLSSVFAKAGVSTRAELAGVVVHHAHAERPCHDRSS